MALRSAPAVCAKTKTTTPSTASVITPNEDSVKEVKVVANNYDAKNGRYAGGQVQVTSANGTNEFHGSAFIKIDRPGLNAYNSWGGPFGGQPQRNNSRFNRIDGSITTDLRSRGAIPRTSRLERHRKGSRRV